MLAFSYASDSNKSFSALSLCGSPRPKAAAIVNRRTCHKFCFWLLLCLKPGTNFVYQYCALRASASSSIDWRSTAVWLLYVLVMTLVPDESFLEVIIDATEKGPRNIPKIKFIVRQTSCGFFEQGALAIFF